MRFKKWLREERHADGITDIHPTQEDINRYLESNSTSPNFSGMTFTETPVFKGNFVNFSLAGCHFKKGVKLKNFSVFHPMVLVATEIQGLIILKNVTLDDGYTANNKTLIEGGLKSIRLEGNFSIRQKPKA